MDYESAGTDLVLPTLERKVERLTKQLEATAFYRKADVTSIQQHATYLADEILKTVELAKIALERDKPHVDKAQLDYIEADLKHFGSKLSRAI